MVTLGGGGAVTGEAAVLVGEAVLGGVAVLEVGAIVEVESNTVEGGDVVVVSTVGTLT
jgi:hypothetical protein